MQREWIDGVYSCGADRRHARRGLFSLAPRFTAANDTTPAIGGSGRSRLHPRAESATEKPRKSLFFKADFATRPL